MQQKQYWLLKTEAGCYSIDDLQKDGITSWGGIRNYQARNFIRDMKKGDLALFYHSSCAEPAAVGVAEVISEPYPDPTQFDKKDEHFDLKATKDKPIWLAVDVKFIKKLKNPYTLFHIKHDLTLKNMSVAKAGNRLSIMPIIKQHYDIIVKAK